MIGKIKPSFTSKNETGYESHWNHYCSSCKAIGSNYGHVYRIGLNYDIVLMGQIVSSLCQIELKESDVKTKKCFSKAAIDPDSQRLFDYLAAIHLLWYKIKLEDDIEDEKSKFAFLMDKMTHKKTSKAVSDLNKMGLDVQKIELLLLQQSQIEHSKDKTDLDSYCVPTEEITGYLFEFSAQMLNKVELMDTCNTLGKAFGKAVYLHDAAMDFESDINYNKFNPFINSGFSKSIKELNIVNNVAETAWNDVLSLMNQLPISKEQKQPLVNRIKSIRKQLHCSSSQKCCNVNGQFLPVNKKEKWAVAATGSMVAAVPDILVARSNSSDNICEHLCGMICCTVIAGCVCGCLLKPATSTECGLDLCCEDTC